MALSPKFREFFADKMKLLVFLISQVYVKAALLPNEDFTVVAAESVPANNTEIVPYENEPEPEPQEKEQEASIFGTGEDTVTETADSEEDEVEPAQTTLEATQTTMAVPVATSSNTPPKYDDGYAVVENIGHTFRVSSTFGLGLVLLAL